MKLATTFLVIFQSFGFITAGPAPSLEDVTSTVKPTWPVFKRALNGWNPPDTLSKRSHGGEQWAGQLQPDHARAPPPHAESPASAQSSAHGHESEQSTAARLQPQIWPPWLRYFVKSPDQITAQQEKEKAQPQIWPGLESRDGSFIKFHDDMMSDKQKIKWMSTAPFQWNIDPSTKGFVETSNVNGLFSWKKAICDKLRERGCHSGLISMKKYPPGSSDSVDWSWYSGHPYAEVHHLEPPLPGEAKVTVSPWGEVHLVHPPVHHNAQLQEIPRQQKNPIVP